MNDYRHDSFAKELKAIFQAKRREVSAYRRAVGTLNASDLTGENDLARAVTTKESVNKLKCIHIRSYYKVRTHSSAKCPLGSCMSLEFSILFDLRRYETTDRRY